MKEFVFKWNPSKNSFILPEEFKTQFDSNQTEIPLILVDDNGNKESIIYNYLNNSILLKSIYGWINDFQPKKNEEVALTHEDGYRYRIAILNRDNRQNDGLYLGKIKDNFNQNVSNRNFVLPQEDLVTHFFICGAAGSGKTVLGKSIIEEAAKKTIPSIIIDLKGDLSSLGIIFNKYDKSNISFWVNVSTEKKEETSKKVVEEMNDGLMEFGFSEENISEYSSKMSVAIFTPKNDKGIQLAITSPLESPLDIKSMILNNKAEVLEMIGSLTESFIKTLFEERKIGRLDKYKTFLQEIVQHCWENDIKLNGRKGLKEIQSFINTPPFEEIGGMLLDSFVNPKMRTELASRIAMCLSGVEQLWFNGVPLQVEKILDRPKSEIGKTPISIINVSDLSFDEQMYVVSQLAYSIYNWARPQGGTSGVPRILFFIDEIGGGGGKQAFYPSHPYNPPSKPPMNVLVKKGRSFGIGCIFATQNPGDIDYKGLSNCGTWAVGRLQTDRDRGKIMEGISTANVYMDNVKRKLEGLEFKNFLIKTKDGKTSFIKERWLVTYHETLSIENLKMVNKPEIVNYFKAKYYS